MKIKNQRGFTLIELLVVVLIIGILSAIALPQYRVAVEKTRLTEALQNIRTLEEQAKLYVLENGLPASGIVKLRDVVSVELSGGEWDDDVYNTKNFQYYRPSILPASTNRFDNGIYIEVNRNSYIYQLLVSGSDMNNLSHDCFDGSGDEMGVKICHLLEGYGWTYNEGEF